MVTQRHNAAFGRDERQPRMDANGRELPGRPTVQKPPYLQIHSRYEFHVLPMSLQQITETLLDWLYHWRFNLCFWGSLILAVLVTRNIPDEHLRWVVGGFLVLAGIVAGLRWDRYR